MIGNVRGVRRGDIFNFVFLGAVSESEIKRAVFEMNLRQYIKCRV